jgi:hypothetical protein
MTAAETSITAGYSGSGTPAPTTVAAGLSLGLADSGIAIMDSLKFAFNAAQGLADLTGSHTVTYENLGQTSLVDNSAGQKVLDFTGSTAQCVDIKPAMPWGATKKGTMAVLMKPNTSPTAADQGHMAVFSACK